MSPRQDIDRLADQLEAQLAAVNATAAALLVQLRPGKPRKFYRDAGTGRLVSRSTADASPGTTVSETVKG
jgi:hypothetical protein